MVDIYMPSELVHSERYSFPYGMGNLSADSEFDLNKLI